MSMLTVEECELLTDSKYRSYISQVEKALRNFEYTSEWADLISALGKLNKVLLSHLKYPVIPKKCTIGKRLAQCLHPALPSGVHLKALESYDIIFKCIGTQRLAHDLFIYSAGLFPLLSHAAMSVKPVLLTVYEKHFVALGRHIKPGLNGLLLGLLPGLEEGAEYFDRTNLLLEDFCDAAGPPFFYTGIWQCVLSCPSVRIYATTFLLSHLNKRQSMEDQLHMIGLDIDLMVCGMCACLQDTSVLVQRSMLDFLLTAFPMHNGQLTRADMGKIVEAAVNVVLRRDMSLNRRLYAWFLGTSSTSTTATLSVEATNRQRADTSSTTSEMDLSYFQTYSKDMLVAALKSKLICDYSISFSTEGPSPILKPFRILISLLDKPEIGPVIIENILLSVFRCLKNEGVVFANAISGDKKLSSASYPESKLPLETLKTANLLFGSFEPYFVWDYIARLFSSACESVEHTNSKKGDSSNPFEDISIVELCDLVEFLLDIISLDVYPETSTEHLPDLLCHVIVSLTAACDRIAEAEITTALKLCSKLFSHVQPSMAGFNPERSQSQDGMDNLSTFSYPDSSTAHSTKTHSKSVGDEERIGGSDISLREEKSNITGGHGQGNTSNVKKDEETLKETNSGPTNAQGKIAKPSDLNSDEMDEKGDVKICVKNAEKMSLPPDGMEVSTSHSFNSLPESEDLKSMTGSVSHSSNINSDITDSGVSISESDNYVKKSTLSSDDFSSHNGCDIKTPSSESLKEGAFIKQDVQGTLNKEVSGHVNLMQSCVQSFQQFFHRFTHLHVLKSDSFHSQSLHKLSQAPSMSKSKGASNKGRGKGNGVVKELCDSETVSTNEKGEKIGSAEISICSHTGKLLLNDASQEVKKAFYEACSLLVVFASFPIYCTDYETIINQMFSKEESSTLPPWLQDLLICSSFVICFEIQHASISTILELINLTQSVQTESENKSRSDGRRSVSEGRVSVVILPALLPSHLTYINQKTHFYEVIALELWNYMGQENSKHHKRAVELFYTLHQVTPNANVCEDVIGLALISESEEERINAFRKFSTLWHLTRSVKTEISPSHSPRTFDRSMFVVLDSLKEESCITKNLALTWLTHVIQRGDTSRVLHPLLLMLLHPDTARVSVQHVNVHKPKRLSLSEDGEDELETKIYAISSEGGNVIYHVNQGKKRMSKSSQDLKSYAVTVVSNKGTASTAPARTHSVTDLSFERVNPESVKLRVNPFGSESSLDKLIFDGYDFPQSSSMPNLEGVKRLNSDTCRKEGIFFDGQDDGPTETDTDEVADKTQQHQGQTKGSAETETTNGSDPQEHTSDEEENVPSEHIVDSILDEIIATVTNQSHGRKESTGENNNMSDVKLCSSDFYSRSLDDLRKFDSSSTSGSEYGDNRNPINLNKVRSAGNLRAESIDSLLSQEADSAPVFDHRDLDPSTDIHELHLHLLLYSQQYDFRRTLYALSTIRAMLLTCPRLVVTAMATTSISSVKPPHLAKLQSLLGRHRKSVFGRNFFGDLPPEVMSSYRSNMFVEIVISLCLYFVRGYYPNLMMSKLSDEELMGNKMVHILCVEILTLLVAELLSIMKDSGKSFVSYISDLLSRCKLQKSLLHCMLASVYNQGHTPSQTASSDKGRSSNTGNGDGKMPSKQSKAEAKQKESFKLTEAIVDFNENSLDPAVNDTFQIKLLQLMLVIIMLEEQIGTTGKSDTQSDAAMDSARIHLTSSLLNVHYDANRPIIQQEMFLSAVWSALKQHHQCHLHQHWVALVTSALPYMGKAMARTVLCVLLQLCRNIEMIASDLTKKRSVMKKVPPDYVVTMLEGLTTLCHYILLDNVSPVAIGQPAPTATNISTETASAGQILTNLIHVFNPVTSGKEPSPARDSAPVSPIMDARSRILSILPRIMGCMATLWKAVSDKGQTEEEVQAICHNPVIGDCKSVRRHILELLSPVSLPHGSHLLAAFAVAWNDRRAKVSTGSSSNRKYQPKQTPCEDQLLLVELIAAIKVLPTDKLIQTVRQVIKQPPHSELSKHKNLPLEVNLLQFFFAYVQTLATCSQLLDSWPSLLGLLRECLQMNLTPPALFLLLQIVNEFVQKTPAMEEKKGQKDLQDICQKVLESVSSIAGSSLEQTTWLRRNFAVKPGPQNEEEGDISENAVEAEVKKEVNIKTPVRRSQASDSKYSVQALSLMAELTAPILDVIYSSEEKDKVAPFLSSLLLNVFPYLRHHSFHNLPSYRACSQMMSSISGYQYTRRSWRKDAFEMLLESNFFQMDSKSIGCWRVVIDNLMTHDKTTFKDLMSRVSITQAGSLNLFSSKEQEYEQRAHMIKRLAFTIFCSETDQYQRAMPDIQERLAECLRLPQVANVMSQVFMCFRVLLLRMSPQHLTSLWPTIITEMVQVLLQIEQELSTETDEFKTQIQRIAALDSSWAHLGNGLNAHNNPAWLNLYLSVCKLLDMCLLLPAELIPQFQLYRWAFVGTAGDEGYQDAEERSRESSWRPNPLFTPHIIRLSRLTNNRIKRKPVLLNPGPGVPLLSMPHIKSLLELQPFFHTLCSINSPAVDTVAAQAMSGSQGIDKKKKNPKTGSSLSGGGGGRSGTGQGTSMSSREHVEYILECDFLEAMT